MIALWRMLKRVFGRKPDVPRDPAVRAAASLSTEKIRHTHQLLDELRSRTKALPPLERARLKYDERLYGTHHR